MFEFVLSHSYSVDKCQSFMISGIDKLFIDLPDITWIHVIQSASWVSNMAVSGHISCVIVVALFSFLPYLPYSFIDCPKYYQD